MSTPSGWTDMIGQLRRAQVARRTMRNHEATPQARDLATAEYSRALDAIFEKLDLMMEVGVIAKISVWLSRAGRV
jgi:hypothetical protein